MSSVLSEYPETLPAPMVGVVVPTERRKISSLHGLQNFRTVQRDRHGTRTYAFTYTREQAAIFREWWAEWEQLGGGWFAANWPLPWSRGPNVFRFKGTPAWSMIGGGNNGQGYWRVSGTVEIRGRGMLPTVEVLYLTSTTYPLFSKDDISTKTHAIARQDNLYFEVLSDMVTASTSAFIYVRDTQKKEETQDSIDVQIACAIEVRIPLRQISISDMVNAAVSASMSARNAVITTADNNSIFVNVGVLINAS
jgi:hypothetical protein